jgi:hypothetical protein
MARAAAGCGLRVGRKDRLSGLHEALSNVHQVAAYNGCDPLRHGTQRRSRKYDYWRRNTLGSSGVDNVDCDIPNELLKPPPSEPLVHGVKQGSAGRISFGPTGSSQF